MIRLRSRPVLAVAAALLLLAAASAALALRAPVAAAGGAEAPALTLPVASVAPRDVRQRIELPGEFRPYQEVDVDAKVRGYVKRLYVDVGDSVRRGQVLAELEIPELADDLRRADAALGVARQQAQRARAQADDDQAIYRRLQGVMQERPELIAQQDLDQARAKADASRASLTAAQAAIAQAQAEQTHERDTEAYEKILAPFDGVITARLRDEGSLVGAGDSGPLFHLSEIARLRLVVNLPESAVPDVAVGESAHVRVSATQADSDLPVSRVSHQLAEATRTMHAEIDYDNSRGAVAPGMYATVELPLKTHSQVLAIPLGALFDRNANGDGGTVYVLGRDGQVQQRQVGLGLADPDYIEVKTGLKAGEQVANGIRPRLEQGIRYVAGPDNKG